MENRLKKTAFTLVELLVALMVTSIVLGAVAVLAVTASNANTTVDSTRRFEAELRFATVKINDLLRFSKLITSADSRSCYIWQLDKDNDGQIDTDETALIEFNSATECLQMVVFTQPPPLINVPVDLISFQNGITGPFLKANCNPVYTILMRNCRNIQLTTDQLPPYTTFLSISFDSAPAGAVQTYQINASLRCWAGFQFDEFGGLNTSDDDGRI
jgi:hypothetical protein